ncbi:glycosyltransferase family 2 protein [Anaerospora hongkongensis]|uniref:glycosyltransferase family 2 protein n=1 Tax=Anaerospora hongkongensis TaxID=244830 RepID=UPI0028A28BC2|nr:glycosyltransferase family A protein [Anaerospora hongkongensis]
MEQKAIAISIIIPVYNAELYLNTCIESVQQQSLKDIEIICIDDGSTDMSPQILQKIKHLDNRMIVVNQENKGAGHARNLGISIASGEYVAFMDADDWYPSNEVLELLYYSAKKSRVNVCGGQINKVIDGQEFILDDDILRNYSGNLNYKDFQFDFYFTRFIYKLSFLKQEKILFPSYKVYEDPLFLVNIMIKTEVFFLIPNIVYMYRGQHKPSLWNAVKIKELLLGFINMLEISREYHLYVLQKKILNRLDSLYLKRLLREIKEEDLEVLQLLIQINNLITWEKLKKDKEKTILKVLDLKIFRGKYLGTNIFIFKESIVAKIYRLIEIYQLNGHRFIKIKLMHYIKSFMPYLKYIKGE